jgi:predicted oxidoreductase (fatty acid repression mutant protein)
MARTRESLGEDISGLVFNLNVWKNNLLACKDFTNGMTIHFNMFGALMKKGIGSNLNSTCIINMKRKE